MRKIYFLIIAIIVCTNVSVAQVTYIWNGANGTDYQDAANWTPARTPLAINDILSFNVAAPVIVTNVPNQTVGAIQVFNGTASVTFSTNNPVNVLNLGAATPLIYTSAGSILAGDILTIQLSAASSFTLNSGTFGIAPSTGGKISVSGALTLVAPGKLDFDVSGTGGTTINATGSVTYNSGTFLCTTPSAINWINGSNYYHNTNGSVAVAIPSSTWQVGSTCNVTGMNGGTIAPTGFAGIDFANFRWNCPAQNGNVNLLPALSVFNITGTFTVTSTGAGTQELQLSASGKATVKVNNYVQTGGTVTLQAAATADTTTLSVSNSFSHSGGGTINGVGGASPGTAIIDFQGGVTRGASSTWQSNSTSNASQFILQFSGSATQTVNLGGSFNFPAQSRCNIVNNNTDPINGISLTGMLRVVNGNSSLPATFTMNGKISGGGGVSYTGAGSGGTSLIYGGSSAQIATSIEFPVTAGLSNLTINNILGVSFPAGFSRTIPGRLTMQNGNLAVGAGNTLSLTNTTLLNQLTYSTGSYITTGTLARDYPVTGLPTDSSDTRSLFPFGSGNNNRTLRLYFSSATLSSGTPGTISVTHSPVIGVATIAPTIPDNGISLDKRTLSNWNVNPGAFNLGGGGETISLSVVAGNIGAVDDFTKLRLTDGVTGYGTLINANTGTNSVPATGKSGLTMTDLNKPMYIGSDGTTAYNPLIIITFNWTGLGGNTAWTNAGNWTGIGAVGYPSAPTEIAIITSTSGTQPTINTSDNISVYQLTVGGGMTLTMVGNAIINVHDNVNFTGTAIFASTSTFGYASSNNAQTLVSLPYGGLSVSGTAGKTLPATITVTGNYAITGATPVFTSNVFTYSGAGAQRITATNYDNLTITGNRGTGLITLGNGTSNNTIDIKGVFDVSALSNFTSKVDFNTVRFSSTGTQTIPGFVYFRVTQTGGGARIFDPLGATNVSNVITCLTLDQPGSPALYTVTGSKVKFVVSGTTTTSYTTAKYNDLELSGDLKGLYGLEFTSNAYISIAGKFSVSAINYKLAVNPFRFEFNGTADQTITAFKSSPGTPAFKYSNLFIAGGNRNVTLGGAGTDTIAITGTLYAETIALPVIPTPSPFGAGYGFIVAGSTVAFDSSSSTIPVLKPLIPGGYDYNNIFVSSGTRVMEGDMNISGNVTVSGTDASVAQLTVGNGNTARTVSIRGNLVIGGAGAGSKVTGLVDMNTGTTGSTKINLSDSLKISGHGQLMGTTSDNAKNGVIVFNGTTTQTYSNTAPVYKNGLVNFIVGDGTTTSSLKLLTSMNLLTSGVASPNRDSLTVANNASIDFDIFNLTGNGTGSAVFSLQSGATLITANTGGVEGTATSGSNGSVINNASIIKTYNDTASYTFNGITTTPFSTSVPNNKMANLTIGANVTLDKSVAVSNTLTLKSATTFALSNSNLNLRSTAGTTARIAAVPDNANISYGTGRFIVERYYPARRAWRLVTAPVTVDAAKTVFNSWQMGGAATSGSGTFVTGPGANPAANGLDVSPMNNYSLKTFDVPSNNLLGVANTYNQKISGTVGTQGIPDNIGMFLFVRGDRSTTNLFNTSFSNTTTLRDTGKAQIHSQTFTLNAADQKWDIIGNPFASPVDITNIMATATNINPLYFWAYDPYLNATDGAYVTMTLFGGTWVPTPSNPSVTQDKNIQSSQAFFVQKNSNAPGTMVFNETHKSAQNNLAMFRPLAQPAMFRSNLYLLEADNNKILADGNLVAFDNEFSSAVDNGDAIKFGNTKETFYMLRDTKSLIVERRKPVVANDTLFFKLSKTTQRSYQFEFVPTHMDPLLTAFLEDRYTGAQTPVSVSTASTFTFTVNGDAKSAASDRFRIVFKATATIPLPVTYSSIKAYQKGSGIAVDWTVENELNINKYEVEKSADGVHFTRVNTTAAKGTGGGTNTYSFLDVKPLQGNNFYRVVDYSQSGAVEYSRVVVVKIGSTVTGISIYPNPVKGNMIGVAFNNMEKGLYDIRLINTQGQTLMNQQLNHAAGSSMETLTPASRLSTGIYQLEITAPGKRVSTIKVIVH